MTLHLIKASKINLKKSIVIGLVSLMFSGETLANTLLKSCDNYKRHIRISGPSDIRIFSFRPAGIIDGTNISVRDFDLVIDSEKTKTCTQTSTGSIIIYVNTFSSKGGAIADITLVDGPELISPQVVNVNNHSNLTYVGEEHIPGTNDYIYKFK